MPTPLEVVARLIRPVYLPWLLTGLGSGMLVPVLPLYLRNQGLSFTAVSVVLAAAGFGAMVGSMPAGGLVARLGERQLLLAAIAGLAVTITAVGFTTAIIALVVLRTIAGACRSAVRLANQSALTRTVEAGVRGRTMALMGGTRRLAFLVGPLAGGFLADLVGFRSTFAIIGAMTLLGAVPVLAEGRHGAVLSRPAPQVRASVLAALRTHRTLLVRSSVGPALVVMVRSGRHVVVPLIAQQLGMSNTAVGALVAVGTGADLLLFPVAGFLMDRFGRLSAMVPAFGLLAIGLLILAGADTTEQAIVAGVVMGIGNGLSSGTLFTLGSDLAPKKNPGPFLAALAALQDTGAVVGPLLVGWLADAAGLGTSAFALAIAMFVGIAWIVFVIGETG